MRAGYNGLLRHVKLLLILATITTYVSAAPNGGYVGRDVCAGCHTAIAGKQSKTAMARTWHGSAATDLGAAYGEKRLEGPDPAIEYQVRRVSGQLKFTVAMPGSTAATFPVETTMGGQRHGLSFLVRVGEIGGTPLSPAPLVEGRYLHYAPDNDLRLSPGFPPEKPRNFETAIGRVLTPGFEKKCLACHGAPRTYGTHQETGVSCENCHGPGQAHLLALSRKAPDKAILNPRKQPPSEQMNTCAQCHAGFSKVQDPMPDDLLISDQVTALENTECWRQSGGKIGCVNCHDPHADAARQTIVARSEQTCLGCHSAQVAQRAGLCPVNRQSGCVGCHMPEDKSDPPFVITDHWIRVRSQAANNTTAEHPEWRSKIAPKRVFLRAIVLDNQAKATEIQRAVANGGSFFELARANSLDRGSAMNGGYLGDVEVPTLQPEWQRAVVLLQPGEVSDVIAYGDKFCVLQRMPRNFREDAETRFKHAMELRKAGDKEKTAAELLEALKIYPRLLRALTYLGIAYGEAGNAQVGAGILSVATRLYRDDAGAHFNLGIAYGALGNAAEISEYKRALEIDSDYVPAYLNLGAAFFAKGQYPEAVNAYREGISINPLVASLHYSLGLALERQNQTEQAKAEMALAAKIDPQVAEH